MELLYNTDINLNFLLAGCDLFSKDQYNRTLIRKVLKLREKTGGHTMEYRWKTEDFVFDTFREAEVWAHSLSNEMMAAGIHGYQTPDEKIACALSFYLAKVPENIVHTDYNGKIYKVWYNVIS